MNFAKWIAPVMVVSGVVVFGAEPVAAGGSPWNVTADHYEVSDTAFAWAPIAWEHNPALGTPEDGPYFAYLVPFDPTRPMPDTAPAGAVEVGEVRVSLEPYDDGGVRFGPHHATIEFEVPELPDGVYTLGHCNSPCTKRLGDLWPALFTIGPVAIPPPTSSPSTTPPTMAAPQPTIAEVTPIARRSPAIEASTSTADSWWNPYFVGALVAILAVAAAITITRLRARPSRSSVKT